MALAAIRARSKTGDETAAFETPEQAAQIPGIDLERLAQLGGCRGLAIGQLVEQAYLGKREGTVEQSLVEDSDPAGVEPVEPADGVDAGIG